jgi:hypothetical protein
MRVAEILLTCLFGFTPLVAGFNPTWFLVGGIAIDNDYFNRVLKINGVGSIGRPHEAMTNAAITSRYGPYFGINAPSKSMHDARREIEEGSIATDNHDDDLKQAEDPTCHFDDETFILSNQRLIDTRKNVTQWLKEGKVGLARNRLGRALHTLQDFYSHSNWVELGRKSISASLGRTDALGQPIPLELPTVDRTTKTCTTCSYPLIDIGTGLTNAGPIEIATDTTCRTHFLGDDPMSLAGKISIASCMELLEDIGDGPVCDKNLNVGFIDNAESGFLTTG